MTDIPEPIVHRIPFGNGGDQRIEVANHDDDFPHDRRSTIKVFDGSGNEDPGAWWAIALDDVELLALHVAIGDLIWQGGLVDVVEDEGMAEAPEVSDEEQLDWNVFEATRIAAEIEKLGAAKALRWVAVVDGARLPDGRPDGAAGDADPLVQRMEARIAELRAQLKAL